MSVQPPETPPAPEPAGQRRFRRTQRVLRQQDFARALRHGLRANDAFLTLTLHGNDLPHARLGLIVGRRYGGAVQRNRAKRLLREAFRLEQYDLPRGFDLVVAPRPAARLTLARCRASLRALSRRLAQRWQPPAS